MAANDAEAAADDGDGFGFDGGASESNTPLTSRPASPAGASEASTPLTSRPASPSGASEASTPLTSRPASPAVAPEASAEAAGGVADPPVVLPSRDKLETDFLSTLTRK
jgi:hypothetical protein